MEILRKSFKVFGTKEAEGYSIRDPRGQMECKMNTRLVRARKTLLLHIYFYNSQIT